MAQSGRRRRVGTRAKMIGRRAGPHWAGAAEMELMEMSYPRRGLSRQPSLNRAGDILPLLHRLPRNRGSAGSRREGLTLAADRRQPFGWPMTRNNARIIAKYLREAGWS